MDDTVELADSTRDTYVGYIDLTAAAEPDNRVRRWQILTSNERPVIGR